MTKGSLGMSFDVANANTARRFGSRSHSRTGFCCDAQHAQQEQQQQAERQQSRMGGAMRKASDKWRQKPSHATHGHHSACWSALPRPAALYSTSAAACHSTQSRRQQVCRKRTKRSCKCYTASTSIGDQVDGRLT